MFAAEEEASALQQAADFAKRFAAKTKEQAAQGKAIVGAVRDIRKSLKRDTAPTTIVADRSGTSTLYGLPATYVYAGAGLLIAAGLGYIIYNRMK